MTAGPGRSSPVRLLVVGYGSELHRDDAAGRVVADRVAALRLPGVRVRSVCQLVPELVEDLAGCGRVAFVDADRRCAEVTVRPVPAPPASGGDGGRAVTHHGTPQGLLRLAATVGVVPPAAVVVGVPAVDVELGCGLSARTRDGVEAAVAAIRELAGAPISPDGDAAGQGR